MADLKPTIEKVFKPSIEKVFKDLEGFQYETKMYVYHKLNGREDEAQSYLNTYKFEQEQIMKELEPIEPKKNNEQLKKCSDNI
jgi:hypothetical protein